MKYRICQFLESYILPDNKLIVIAAAEGFHLGTLSSRIHVLWALRAGGRLGVGNDPVYVKTKCFDPFPFPDASDSQKAEIRALAEELDTLRKRQLAAHQHLTLTGMYNVLEKLRAGTSPEALRPDEKLILDDGLVLILKELHERLDVAVAAAYGWPADLADDEILARLVALNHERAAEEARGNVRWLRPDYQIPRFGTQLQNAEQLEAALVGTAGKTQKPSFPAEEVAQTAAVMAVLAGAAAPLDAASLAGRFRQGKRVEGKVAAVLAAGLRQGFVRSPDGGATYQLPRAA
jgi:hypothetical protein